MKFGDAVDYVLFRIPIVQALWAAFLIEMTDLKLAKLGLRIAKIRIVTEDEDDICLRLRPTETKKCYTIKIDCTR